MEHCIDFALPQGTPICAARGGRVTERVSRFSKSFDDPEMADRCNRVVLLHDDGEESVYVHLARGSVRVKYGQRVRMGQVIARSGQTGYATYPHLHFGVYDDAGDSKKVKLGRPSR
ncbi:MAG: M23 family metallopeptidase [Candidatus Liptonbacteria bacterium]|nr:M23 family metallopeptidase [Candidatus Liptonbacteria bacterium]